MVTNPTRATLDRIKEAVNLLALVSEHMTLRAMGNDALGLCPFHKEDTPSFRVHPAYFKCFGCGASGDAIDFLSLIEGMSKMDAIRVLSDRTGISLDGPRPTRLQVAYDKDAAAFAEWWWVQLKERLALRLSELAEGYCWGYIAEERADADGLLWRQVAGLDHDARRRLCLLKATELERREWKERVTSDKETTDMIVDLLGDAGPRDMSGLEKECDPAEFVQKYGRAAMVSALTITEPLSWADGNV